MGNKIADPYKPQGHLNKSPQPCYSGGGAPKGQTGGVGSPSIGRALGIPSNPAKGQKKGKY